MNVAAIVISLVALVIGAGGLVIARQARDESRRIRIDILSPTVTVTDARAVRERFLVGPYTIHQFTDAPPILNPDHQLIWPADKDVRVLLAAHLVIRNEGTRTTTVSVGGFLVSRCDFYDDLSRVIGPDASAPSTKVHEGRIELRPGEQVGLLVRDGPTLAEWKARGNASLNVEVTANSSPDTATDRWTLTLDGDLLVPIQHDESHFRAVPHTLPTVTLTQLGRSYPPQRRP